MLEVSKCILPSNTVSPNITPEYRFPIFASVQHTLKLFITRDISTRAPTESDARKTLQTILEWQIYV